MNKIAVIASLIALTLGVFTAEANAAAGGFCRSAGGEMPVCQR